MADYLLAARTAMQAHVDSTRRLEEMARARRLDAAVLGRWLAHLQTAVRDENDALHNWAKVAVGTAAADGKHFAKLGEERDEKGTQLLLDYAHSKADDWLADGFAFGPGPVRPGELHIGGDREKPILRFREYAAAEKDPVWDVLKLAPGTANDPGALGSVVRAGRTLRTPTFSLTNGRVFYLVKGSGFVYAAVGSHVMIAGPLHGQIVRTVNTGDRFQWVGHDLSAYQGQRIHLEFTPTSNGDFAIAKIVQGDNPPPDVEHPNPLLCETFAGAGTPEALAEAYQRLFLDTLDKLAADRIVSSTTATEHARLANWLIGHADLFGAAGAGEGETRAFLAQQARIAAGIQRESRLCVAMIDGSPENEYVFIRGSPKARGETVPRRFLEALAVPSSPAISHGSGRLELARQMIDPVTNPFLPRVLVNRVWHHLFGRGIVASTDNFGVLGERPTHPELLDYLADRFVRDGWSIKKMIRALVLSSAYRMASQADEASDRADPDDVLLHRMRRRRLEGEAIRDAILVVSGRLVDRLYGPPVPIHLTEFQAGRGRPASGPINGDGRRSLYLSVRRNFLSPFLLAFDTPSPFSTVGRRTVSNVPAQSLILLNDPFVHEQAQRWAQRVLAQPGTPRERIIRMYESAFTHPPTEMELSACLDYLERRQANPTAWADLAHVLFNVKDFLFLN